MRNFITLFILAALAFPAKAGSLSRVSELISEYISGKDARIGVAVITDSGDSLSVNGRERFPMMSVFKFPVALAVADRGIALDSAVRVGAGDLLPDTYSPLRDRIGRRDTVLTVGTLFSYSLQQSDNNACDILLRLTGGPSATDSLMKALGFAGITVGATEADMHARAGDVMLNRADPVSMARLMMEFSTDIRHRSPIHGSIAEMMEGCTTGTDRLAAPLAGSGAVIGHKTGTGDIDPKGRITALNDAGYINLPSGHRYAIAVFVADSGMGMAETSAVIAGISEIVFRELSDGQMIE